jgi:signal peptidase I
LSPLRALWALGLPAVLTTLAFRWLVPPVGLGAPGFVASLGHRHPLPVGVTLFLLFSAVARYWWSSLRPGRTSDGRGVRETGRRRVAALAGLAALVGAAVVAGVAFRAWIAAPYRILGASMLPTLEPGDVVAGRRTGPSAPAALPARGDLVVFRSSALGSAPGGVPWAGVLVKRVIAWPGDRVAMRGGAPVINGWPVPWCDAGEYLYPYSDATAGALHGRLRVEFLEDRAYLTVHSMGARFEGSYRVKPGEVFVLGDNRGSSLDSRALDGGRGGGVPIAAIDAHAQWFLVGTHRSGDVDLGRLLRPVDALQTRVRLEGVRTETLEDGVARCLRDRPTDTRPPPPDRDSVSDGAEAP